MGNHYFYLFLLSLAEFEPTQMRWSRIPESSTSASESTTCLYNNYGVNKMAEDFPVCDYFHEKSKAPADYNRTLEWVVKIYWTKKIQKKFYNQSFLLYSAFFSTMWDKNSRIKFTDIRRDSINIIKYKIWRSNFWVVKSYWLLWQISSLGREHPKSAF